MQCSTKRKVTFGDTTLIPLSAEEEPKLEDDSTTLRATDLTRKKPKRVHSFTSEEDLQKRKRRDEISLLKLDDDTPSVRIKLIKKFRVETNMVFVPYVEL